MKWTPMEVMGLILICTGCSGYLLHIGHWGWFIAGGNALWIIQIWADGS